MTLLGLGGYSQVIIQGVHDTYDTYQRPTKEEDSLQGCVIVLIGINLHKDSLIAMFKSHASIT